MPPLASRVDVADVPGAGALTDRQLELAGEDVRGYCGWHIAPTAVTTAAVSGSGGPRLVLPSLRVVAVLSVVDVAGVELTGWRALPGGLLYRAAGWPRGDHNVLVEMRHGHEELPGDLVPVVLERARGIESAPEPGVRTDNRTVGGVSRSRTYSEGGPRWSVAAGSVLDRHSVTSPS